MSDREEKVLKGLECCTKSISNACPMECPFWDECMTKDDGSQMYSVMHAALELLKHDEQTIESLKRTIDKLTKALAEKPEVVRCKDCKHWDKTTRDEGNDCISGPWEDAVCEVFRDWDSYGELGEHFWRTNGDWFCADGERR